MVMTVYGGDGPLDDACNFHGRQGWELVNACPENGGVRLFFKRPIG
jgi:hypothetical protein